MEKGLKSIIFVETQRDLLITHILPQSEIDFPPAMAAHLCRIHCRSTLSGYLHNCHPRKTHPITHSGKKNTSQTVTHPGINVSDCC